MEPEEQYKPAGWGKIQAPRDPSALWQKIQADPRIRRSEVNSPWLISAVSLALVSAVALSFALFGGHPKLTEEEKLAALDEAFAGIETSLALNDSNLYILETNEVVIEPVEMWDSDATSLDETLDELLGSVSDSGEVWINFSEY